MRTLNSSTKYKVKIIKEWFVEINNISQGIIECICNAIATFNYLK